jgi:phosphoribosylamine--glycine ligase
MNILLLGSGGREHALAWKIKQSSLCKNLFITPGNAGTNLIGKNIDINYNDFNAQKEFCIANQINMVVVGPEEPLVNGIYDFYTNDVALKNIIVIAPSAKAAQLEGSKSFSKYFMQRHQIPTAAYKEFTKENFEEGKAYIQQHSLPIVLKADGLAAGKGVIICQTTAAALQSFEDMLLHQQFGSASNKVVIEEFLTGIEVSVFVITNGKDYQIIGHAKDYKKIGEGETGLNTGGMGCVTPVPFMDNLFMQKVTEKIIEPTIQGLYQEQLTYHGFLFFGLMNVNGEPYVIEYNCRMGDPETEVVMPRLTTDLVQLFLDIHHNQLGKTAINYQPDFFATVMAVSGGYPGDYKKNIPISFSTLNPQNDSIIFHAGTKKLHEQIVTNGGRVLTVTSHAPSIALAVEKSIQTLQTISFEGMYFRKDIGFEFI